MVTVDVQSLRSTAERWDKQCMDSRTGSCQIPNTSKSVGIPDLNAGPIPEGFAGVLVRWPTKRLRCSYQISVT